MGSVLVQAKNVVNVVTPLVIRKSTKEIFCKDILEKNHEYFKYNIIENKKMDQSK